MDYPPRDLRWGLVEASKGKIGNPVDELLLLCYSYDPLTGGYGIAVMNALRGGAVLAMISLEVLFLSCCDANAKKVVRCPQKKWSLVKNV